MPVEQHLEPHRTSGLSSAGVFRLFGDVLVGGQRSALGARRGYAILGIATVALVSSVGGGLLRDGIFLQTIPVLLTAPVYFYIIAFAVVLVLVFGARVQHWRHLGTS